ncbi:hypothetical protein ABPG74_016375 [Tetrahymena malaccensis]
MIQFINFSVNLKNLIIFYSFFIEGTYFQILTPTQQIFNNNYIYLRKYQYSKETYKQYYNMIFYFYYDYIFKTQINKQTLALRQENNKQKQKLSDFFQKKN